MTIVNQSSRRTVQGNGSQTVFDYNFLIPSAADAELYLVDAVTGVSSLLPPSAWTLSGANNPSGGTFTYPAASGAPALKITQKLTLVRTVPNTQTTNLQNQSGFQPRALESALDRIVMQLQQVADGVSRSIRLPPYSPPGKSTLLPDPSPQKLIGWDAAGTGLQNIDASTLATIVAYSSARADLFNGDGARTQFTLTANPGNQANLDVSVGGVTKYPGIDYTWLGGTAFSFVVAPPAGVNNILVRYYQGLPGIITEAQDVTYLPGRVGAVANTVQNKLRENVSLTDFGAVGDGTTNATPAVNAAEALPHTQISLPIGRYSTTLTPYQAINQTYTGPGKLVMGGYAQAPKRSFINSELTPADANNRERIFDGDWTNYAHNASYTFVAPAATGTPTNTYKSFFELSSEVLVYDYTAGFNTSPSLESAGRSGAFLRAELIYHGGQGDIVGRSCYGHVYSNRPGATHWLSQPAVGADNGIMSITSPSGSGAYLQREEFILRDNGYVASATYQVANLIRDNASAPLGNVWLFSRPQSIGAHPIDGFYVPFGKSKRGIDFGGSDFGTDKAAVITKPNDRWYLNGYAAPDSIGAVFITTTLGGEWVSYASSDARVEIASKGRRVFAAGANSSSAVSWLEAQARETGGGVWISAGSTDADCPIVYNAKGSGGHQFRTNGFGPIQLQINHVANATNFVAIQGSNGAAPEIITNAGDLRLQPGGGGLLRFGTHTAGALSATGFIEIRDAGGTLRRVLVG